MGRWIVRMAMGAWWIWRGGCGVRRRVMTGGSVRGGRCVWIGRWRGQWAGGGRRFMGFVCRCRRMSGAGWSARRMQGVGRGRRVLRGCWRAGGWSGFARWGLGLQRWGSRVGRGMIVRQGSAWGGRAGGRVRGRGSVGRGWGAWRGRCWMRRGGCWGGRVGLGVCGVGAMGSVGRIRRVARGVFVMAECVGWDVGRMMTARGWGSDARRMASARRSVGMMRASPMM